MLFIVFDFVSVFEEAEEVDEVEDEVLDKEGDISLVALGGKENSIELGVALCCCSFCCCCCCCCIKREGEGRRGGETKLAEEEAVDSIELILLLLLLCGLCAVSCCRSGAFVC